MAVSELDRIAEIDRSERITQQYKSHGGVLELVDVDIHAPRWGEPGEHPVGHYIELWKPMLDGGALFIGALDGECLVGFAIYDPSLPHGPPNFAALYVTRTQRGKSVGRELTEEVVRLARAEGAMRLYVSSIPTRGTVDFYMKQGFKPLATPDARLFALEPDDIHMERVL